MEGSPELNAIKTPKNRRSTLLVNTNTRKAAIESPAGERPNYAEGEISSILNDLISPARNSGGSYRSSRGSIISFRGRPSVIPVDPILIKLESIREPEPDSSSEISVAITQTVPKAVKNVDESPDEEKPEQENSSDSDDYAPPNGYSFLSSTRSRQSSVFEILSNAQNAAYFQSMRKKSMAQSSRTDHVALPIDGGVPLSSKPSRLSIEKSKRDSVLVHGSPAESIKNRSASIIKDKSTNASSMQQKSGDNVNTKKYKVDGGRPLPFWEEYWNRVKKCYYEKVSFRTECVLQLFLLLPFVILGFAVLYLDYIILPDSSSALIFKLVLISVGVIANVAVATLNQKHAQLLCMISITKNSATVDNILTRISRKGVSQELKLAAIWVYGCLITAELSMTYGSVETAIGLAKHGELAQYIPTITPKNPTEIFLTTLGTRFACKDCLGYSSGSRLLVPVSNFLSKKPELESKTFLSKTIQDLSVIQANCMTLSNITHPVELNKVSFEVKKFIEGENAALLEIQIHSRTSQGLFGQHCNIVFRDAAAFVNKRYKQTFIGEIRNKKVEEVRNTLSTSCNLSLRNCIDASQRANLSMSLLSYALPFQKIDIEQNLIYTSGLLPNVLQQKSSATFAAEVQQFFAALLVQAAGHFVETERDILLFSDESRVKLLISPILQYLTVIVCAICVLFSVFLISADLIRIERIPNELLRKLNRVLKPGKDNLEALAPFVAKNFESQKDWNNTLVRFGENRNTVKEPLGRLIFGTKKDIAKFKEDRCYI